MIVSKNMRRDVNNKIKNGQKLCRPSLSTLLNGLHYISAGKVLVDKGFKSPIGHGWKIKQFFGFHSFWSQFRNPMAETVSAKGLFALVSDITLPMPLSQLI
jgi:hypothetical protein